ncbi:MAG: D-glycerate dehydrogenase [Nitrospinae bacterium]|nr:D-glycerate dehydrogenase [Nitrospinota bacterium]
MKPVISITNVFPEAAIEKLKPRGELRLNRSGAALTRDDLKKLAAESAAIVSYLSDPIDREIIEAGGNLKIVANYGAGYNNIDVASAREKGVWVTNTPGVLHETTADLTWAMILAVARQIAPADRFTRQNLFTGWRADLFLGADAHGKTLGVIGCGEIGRAVARRALGFGMKVLYCQRRRLPDAEEKRLNAEYVSLEELLRNSDYVTLHVPLTDQTRHMIGRDQLRMMKRTAYLVHAARGKVVDDRALVEALKAGEIAGAALDVYEDEPALTPGMTNLDNLLLLPHIGSATRETRDRMALLVADNVLDALSGKRPRASVW